MSNFKKQLQPREIQLYEASLRLNKQVKEREVLQEMVEILEDGIMIVDIIGDLVYRNAAAENFFHQINQGYCEYKFVPSMIWSLCQKLINNQSLYPENNITICDEILINNSKPFRICIKLLNLERFAKNYFFVVIENQHEYFKNTILMERQEYDLTPREAEVWQLYRSKYSYKEIADQLYITINTVKKHMKNIHEKRRQ